MTQLTDLLDAYTARIATLPVPPLNVPPGFSFEQMNRFRSIGLRVSDRLLPGASDLDIAQFEGARGFSLPDEAREWFQWHNGHAGGLSDSEDTIAQLLPFGRQYDLAASLEAVNEPGMDECFGKNDQPVVMAHTYYEFIVVECGPADLGSVWFFSYDGEYVRLFDSLSDLVRHAILLFDLGWITLNEHGGAELVREEVLEADGVVFADDWERSRYRNYGKLPSSIGG